MKLPLLMLLFVAARLAVAQELCFREFPMNSRLPSWETYSIIQDHKGYLWIATDEGLCKYSRGRLEVFDKRKGLPEKSVYASLAASDGKLWVGTLNERFLYYDGKIFREAPFQPAYRKLLSGDNYGFSFPFRITENKQRELYLQSYFMSVAVNTSTGKFRKLGPIPSCSALFIA